MKYFMVTECIGNCARHQKHWITLNDIIGIEQADGMTRLKFLDMRKIERVIRSHDRVSDIMQQRDSSNGAAHVI